MVKIPCVGAFLEPQEKTPLTSSGLFRHRQRLKGFFRIAEDISEMVTQAG